MRIPVKVPDKQSFVVILLLGLVCFFTYASSLGNGFLMDDYCIFLMQDAFHPAQFLQLTPENLRTDIYFRPVTHFLSLLTTRLFRGNPWPYTLTNLIL